MLRSWSVFEGSCHLSFHFTYSIKNEFNVHFWYTHRIQNICFYFTSLYFCWNNCFWTRDFAQLNQTSTGKKNKGSHFLHSSIVWCNYYQRSPLCKAFLLIFVPLKVNKFAVPSPQGSVPAEQTFPTRAVVTEDHRVSPWSSASHSSHVFPPSWTEVHLLLKGFKVKGKG